MTSPKLNAAVPVLPVHDIKKAAGFYQDRLGFQVGHAESSYAVLMRDGIEIHLWAATDETWRDHADTSARKTVITGAESFLAGTASARVHVEGIETLCREIRKSGVLHPNGALADKPYGFREFAVLDLDGNLITFFANIDQPKA